MNLIGGFRFLIVTSLIGLSFTRQTNYKSTTREGEEEEAILLQQLFSNSPADLPEPAVIVVPANAAVGAGTVQWRRSKGRRRGWRSRRPVPTTTSTQVPPPSRSVRGDPANPLPRHWLDLEAVPPSKVSAKLHGDVFLECEAVGSPPPVIYWLRNGKPLDRLASFDSVELANGLDVKASLLEGRNQGNFAPSDFAMAKIKSKLPLRCIRPEEEGKYTCVADNAVQQMTGTTNVLIEEDDPSLNWKPHCEFKLPSSLQHKKGHLKGTKAYIHVAESLHMENMGKDIILPCRAGGRPKPLVSWTGNDGQIIQSGKKFHLNTNGDLVIRSLSWGEMGEYSCLAENAFGYDVASTFLYPLLNDDDEEARA